MAALGGLAALGSALTGCEDDRIDSSDRPLPACGQVASFTDAGIAPSGEDARAASDSTGGGSAGGLADASASSESTAESASNASLRRNVIIVVGDGMQLAHEIATSRYLTGRDFGLSFHSFPVVVFKTTWDVGVYNLYAHALDVPEYNRSGFDPTIGYDPAQGGSMPHPLLPDNEARRAYIVDGPAAFSASTATAMSTGFKTDSERIAWLPGGASDGALETSAERLRRAYGMAIGFVTTDSFTGATPAGWFSHNRSRWSSGEIAHEMLTQVRPDVIVGGAIGNATQADLTAACQEYLLVERDVDLDGSVSLLAAAVMAKQQQKKLLGLFGPGSFVTPTAADRPGNPVVVPAVEYDPTLAAASVAALEVLSRDPDGFFLLVEQAGIDAANHVCDFRGMVGAVQDLDAAVGAIVAFVDRPDDGVDWTNTTLLVTADHANSYLRLERPLERGDLPAQDGASYPDGEVFYERGGHTNELTTVYARGMAAAKLTGYANVYPGLNIIDDTSIYRLTLQAAKR